nr:IS110 family transposase [Paenibacillus popilliae]
MNQFPTADHLASWAGVAPGNHESAGKKKYKKGEGKLFFIF